MAADAGGLVGASVASQALAPEVLLQRDKAGHEAALAQIAQNPAVRVSARREGAGDSEHGQGAGSKAGAAEKDSREY